MTIAGTDNRIAYANAACEQIYGYATTELIGQQDVMFFPPGEHWADDNDALASRGDKWEGEVAGISKEGRDLVVELRVTLIRNERREITGRVVVHREITERVRAEAAEARLERERAVSTDMRKITGSILENEGKYRYFAEQVRKYIPFDRITFGSADLERGTLIITHLTGTGLEEVPSRGVVPLAGSIAEHVMGTRLGALVQTEDGKELAASFPSLLDDLKSGLRSCLAVPLVSNDQVIGALQLQSTRPNSYDEEDLGLANQVGMEIGAAITHTNLIARCGQAEEDARKAEAKNRALLAVIPDLMFRITRVGKLLDYMSPENDLAVFPDAHQGEEISSVVPAEIAGQILYHVGRALQSDKMQALELQVPSSLPNGGVRDYEALIMSSGEDEAICVMRDISESKRLEGRLLQAQKMEAVGRLAGGMAHDFNNLLTPIMSYAGLAAGTLSPQSKLHGYQQEIQMAAERASHLTRQLLSFPRHQSTEPEIINLNDLIINIDRMLRRLISEDIELITLLTPDLPRIRVNHGQMEQVLVNLAVNARDAMPDGGELIIKSENVVTGRDPLMPPQQVPAGQYVVLTVSDTGVGMLPEVQRRMFDPFFTTKSAGRGTGLGLSTCHSIVSASGGYILTESELGRGSTFKIFLPRVCEAAAQPPSEGEFGSLPVGSATVLVVEDQPMVREVVSSVLSVLGYTVLEAANGQHALGLVRGPAENPIHLLLTDVVMPLMGGPELAEQLREIQPETRVLYTSGYIDDSIVHRGVVDPATAFIQKPFTRALLARRVREVLEG